MRSLAVVRLATGKRSELPFMRVQGQVQPRLTAGCRACPAAFGIGLQLAFRTRTGGPVVALVQTDQPCGMVDFTVTGQRLLGLENNISVDRQVLAIASLPWKLPNPLRAPERPDRCWAGSPAIEPAADKADIACRATAELSPSVASRSAHGCQVRCPASMSRPTGAVRVNVTASS